MPNKPQRTIADRIMDKVEMIPISGCWIWIGCADGRGYGSISVPKQKNPRKAHLVSYEVFIGEITAGMVVRHKCDVSYCVAPHHLELGTQKQNMQDASKRGRLNPKSLLNLQMRHQKIIKEGMKNGISE